MEKITSAPPPVQDRSRMFVARGPNNPPEPGLPSDDSQPIQLPISNYLWILRQHRWRIGGFVAACVLVSYILCSRTPQEYDATATIEVDRQSPSGVVGQEASQTAANDVDQFLATQMKIIQSDSVLRPVVAQLVTDKTPAVAVSDAPIKLKNLRVTRPANTYLFLVSYRSRDAAQAAEVANAIANSYIEYTYMARIKSSAKVASFMERQLDELRAKMERSSEALAKFERELNVINPEEKTNILSARLLQLNSAYTDAQTDRARKQSAALTYKEAGLEAAAQAYPQGESLLLNQRLNEAEQKFAEAKAYFGVNHPEYRKHVAEIAELRHQISDAGDSAMKRIDLEYQQAARREEILKSAVSDTKEEFDRVNARSFEYRSLKQEAEADRKLYDELVRRIKESGINANFHNNAIRVADPARPADQPVYPNTGLITFLVFLSSTFVAFAAAILGDGLNSKVRDQVHLGRLLNTDVIGALPVMKEGVRAPLVSVKNGEPAKAANGETTRHAEDTRRYREAVSVLRSTIALTDVDRQVRSLLITSANPGEGKTTTAMQLAITNAQQQRRTLLIDADLRRPSVHSRIDMDIGAGLADYLGGGKLWHELVKPVAGVPGLEVMTAGRASRVIHEMALQDFPKLLDEVSANYDLVIVDAAPLPGFAEPLEIARAVDGVVVMARAGKTDRRAVMTVLRTLERVHANVLGVVLNEVRPENQINYYGPGYGNSSGTAA